MATKRTGGAKPETSGGSTKLRPLKGGDLEAIVAVDRAAAGRSRRGFYEKRLAHLAREPGAFVALAAELGGKLAGFAFARLYEGEFGGGAPEASLDAIGVDAKARSHGIGRELVDGVAKAMRGHGVKELSTQANWTEAELMGFFAHTGFTLSPRIVLECAIADAEERRPLLPPARAKTPAPSSGASVELDYSGPSGDDFESLARDRVPIRSMNPGDLAAIVHIDKRITGRDRQAYYKRKLAEAMEESAVRVSLVAEIDGQVAGVIMARVEFGEFGHSETEAVMDTIGVDPSYGHKDVASALLSQLFTNLAGLRVERLRTEVGWNHFGLLSFLDRMGFRPHRRLALRRALG
jgi:GNAT superfamily N-acetyltransferase